MKLKEQLAYLYSKNVNEYANVPKQLLRQNAFEAGFEAAKQIALKLSKNYAHTTMCEKHELTDCYASCELVYELQQLGGKDV